MCKEKLQNPKSSKTLIALLRHRKLFYHQKRFVRVLFLTLYLMTKLQLPQHASL